MRKNKIILTIIGLIVSFSGVLAVRTSAARIQNGTLFTFNESRNPQYFRIPCKRGFGSSCPVATATLYYYSPLFGTYFTLQSIAPTKMVNN